MFDRLEVFEKKYEECNQKLYDPAVVSDPEAYAALMKEVKGLEPVVEKYKEYKKQKNNEEEAKQLLAEGGLEKDFREMVELELEEARESLEKISEELKILLLPKDPNDDRNVIVEIRGGAGGDDRVHLVRLGLADEVADGGVGYHDLECGDDGAVLRQPIPDVQHVRGNQAVENGNSQRQ